MAGTKGKDKVWMGGGKKMGNWREGGGKVIEMGKLAGRWSLASILNKLLICAYEQNQISTPGRGTPGVLSTIPCECYIFINLEAL